MVIVNTDHGLLMGEHDWYVSVVLTLLVKRNVLGRTVNVTVSLYSTQ